MRLMSEEGVTFYWVLMRDLSETIFKLSPKLTRKNHVHKIKEQKFLENEITITRSEGRERKSATQLKKHRQGR